MKRLFIAALASLSLPLLAETSDAQSTLDAYNALQNKARRQNTELGEMKNQNNAVLREVKNLEATNKRLEQVLLAADTTSQAPAAAALAEPQATALVSLKLDSEDDLSKLGFNRFQDTTFCTLKTFPDNTAAFQLEVKPDAKVKDAKLYYWFNAKQISGKTITCTIQVKGDGIVRAGNSHIKGGKFMAQIVKSNDKSEWPGANIGDGSFDWKTVSFSTEIPADVKSCTLVLGLEGATGKICFRDLKITVNE